MSRSNFLEEVVGRKVVEGSVGRCGVRRIVLVHLIVGCEWLLPAKA